HRVQNFRPQTSALSYQAFARLRICLMPPLRARVSQPPHPFSIPAYRAFVLARLAMVLAQEAMVVAIGWQVYDLSRQTMGLKESAFRLGLIGVVQFLPLLLLTLVV